MDLSIFDLNQEKWIKLKDINMSVEGVYPYYVKTQENEYLFDFTFLNGRKQLRYNVIMNTGSRYP